MDSLREVGRGEDVGGAEAGADPGEQRARLLVLERPLERVRVQRVIPVETQLRQRRAQRRPAHPRFFFSPSSDRARRRPRGCVPSRDGGGAGGGWAAAAGRKVAGRSAQWWSAFETTEEN